MTDKSDSNNEQKIQVKIVELLEVNGKHVTKEGGKRQYHHKSKNGCDNCKRRRVKCTEEKPACCKCKHLSLECVYSAPQPRRRRTKKELEIMKHAVDGVDMAPSPTDDDVFESVGKKRALVEIKEEPSSSSIIFGDSRQNTNESDISSTSKKRKLSASYDIASPISFSKRKDSKNTIVKYVVTKEDGTKITVDDDAVVSKVKSPRSRSNNSSNGNESKNQMLPNNPSKISIPQTHSSTSLQQMFQQHLNGSNIPQLMSLTSSEKYANTVSASSNSGNAQKNAGGSSSNIDPQFGAIFQNLNPNINSPQSNSMTMTNSIGTFFSLNNAKLLSSLTKNSKIEGQQLKGRPNAGEGTQENETMQPNTSENPATPEIFKKDIGDLSKHLSLSGIKQQLNNNKSPLTSLPKLASAFTSGHNGWGTLLSSLSGGGQNVDDLTTTAMNFLNSVGSMNNSNNYTKLRKGSMSGSQPNGPGGSKMKMNSMIKPSSKSSGNLDSESAGINKANDSSINNPSSSNNVGTPTTLASLANLGMSIGGASMSNIIATSINHPQNNNQNNNNGNANDNSNSNSFGNFHTNHKMSIPSTPNMFQPAGIGGITYDFNELIGGTSNQNNTADPKATHTNNIHDKHKPPSSLLGTPEILKSPLISDNGKAAFSRVQQDLKDEAVEVLSTMATVAQRDKNTANDNKNSPGNILKPQNIDAHKLRSPDIPFLLQLQGDQLIPGLNLVDLKLFHHYLKTVSTTIVDSGICVSSSIWSSDIPELSFQFPFLMHAILAFSATHLSRTQTDLEEIVATHRLDCLKLLKDAVLEITPENTDALVASAIILIMDSLANAVPAQQHQNDSKSDQNNNPAGGGIGDFTTSAWIFHVKGAATILTAVWPLPETSRFFNLINVDLSELGQYLMASSGSEVAVNNVLNDSADKGRSNNLNGLGGGSVLPGPNVTDLVCFDESISDLYPIELDSPYLITLAYLDKLHKGVDTDGFILRIFSFPALMDKTFLLLLMTGDMNSMRIMRCYYKMLRSFVTKKKDKIWFLEGLTQVLPADVDEYSGGGVYMMLDFLGNGLPSMMSNVFESSNMNNAFDFSGFASGNNENNGNINGENVNK